MNTSIVPQIETFIQDYVTLTDPAYALPIALWTVGTFCFSEFDAYAYLVINAPVKRSGKTRLLEMISFCCNKPRMFTAITGPSMFRIIQKEKPTILNDESEEMSSEAASLLRAVLNVGYRKGQTVPRLGQEFDTYCPKAFALIGDVHDTLKDRSIVITMQRAEPRKRFTFAAAQAEGAILRKECQKTVKAQRSAIAKAFREHPGLSFLMDRDEEIWTGLFVLCSIFCPERLTELQRTATDLATAKTTESRRYLDLRKEEDRATDDEYSKRLLIDFAAVFIEGGFHTISTVDALELLKKIPTSPWRTYKGEGLTIHQLAAMLSKFNVRPVPVAVGKGRKDRRILRGYKQKEVYAAAGRL